MQNNKTITLESLSEGKYRSIICYPTYKKEEFKHRLNELKQLNIKTIEFTGQKHIHNIPILGKGCVGIVVAAYRKDEKVALKIRRTDANRTTMQHEAQMLKKANKINVGPRLLRITKNFLLMEYVEGLLFPEWTRMLTGKGARRRLRYVLRIVLEQAWRLDKAEFDHGELSNAPKHIIVKPDDLPCLVDFETASISRRASNVTSLCQYLFIGSSIAKLIQKKLGDIKKDSLVDALRMYKKSKDRKDFEDVLSKCRVL